MNAYVALTVTLTIVIALMSNQEVDAVCCPPPCAFSNCMTWGSFCNDCTKVTPFCGFKPCNIFGCNCPDKKCRSGKGCELCGCPKYGSPFPGVGRKVQCEVNETVSVEQMKLMRVQSQEYLDDVFAQADKDQDGRLRLQEAVKWVTDYHRQMSGSLPVDVQQQVRRLDQNGDGHLTREEIDSRN